MLIRRRRQPGRHFSWTTLAFEVFVVVLGVTLALGANELRQRFVDQRKVRTAKEAIAAELQQNCDRLTRTQAYHERLIADLDSLRSTQPSIAESGAISAVKSVASWKGYSPAFITSTAYETAQVTGTLELMPYDLALGLGNYYTFVSVYQETVRQANGVVMQAGEPTVTQLVVVLQITSELQRELAPQSCIGARELRGEPIESAPDASAAGS